MIVAHQRKKENRCKICDRVSHGELCPYHGEARRRLIKHYTVWKNRTSMDWRGYLDNICSNELVGIWVKEVAGFLLKSGEIPIELKEQNT
jgi:hypothetical protein